jgi:signal transduction histidine kinase
MMLLRRLSVRVLITALLAAALGLSCAAASVGILLRKGQHSTAQALRLWATHTGPKWCEEAPQAWSFRLSGGTRAFAYDVSSRSSRNPGADPWPLASGDPPAHVGDTLVLSRNAEHGRVFALRARESGPCSLIAVTYARESWLGTPARIGITVFLLASLPSALFGFVSVMRPLGRRVQALSRTAAAMGSSGYQPASARASGDELDAIHASMDRAHAHILQDQERLAGRLKTLREHLTNVAHDLRTPLASLQAQVEEALDTSLAPEAQAALQGALRDCVYVAGLTENLRLQSQLEEGWDPARAPALDLAATVMRTAQRLEHYAKRRGISLNHAVPETHIAVLCDPFACEQTLSNIIENAIAHLGPGGQIGILLDHVANGTFKLTIADDGKGVGAADLNRLGERSFRTDEARARDPRGSGLGLAIARTVCERCGWQLAFAHAEAGGLQVEIVGPITSEEREKDAESIHAH